MKNKAVDYALMRAYFSLRSNGEPWIVLDRFIYADPATFRRIEAVIVRAMN
jgi:hypothetical protein